MSDEISIRLISLISSSNMHGWINDYDSELHWSYEDGTSVISFAKEHGEVNSWLETYDELSEKLIHDIEGVSFSVAEIEEILEGQGNLFEFKFTLNFRGDEVTYHYVQFGDGNEAARTVSIPNSAIENDFSAWTNNAIEKEWCVSPLG